MSYRDLRNFTEMMRSLGYPRLISMENFRQPNFSLVSEILTWLVDRYDPLASLPTDTDTEQDRIIFIKSIAQFMASKANIKLNVKKLYTADGYAVKELLKIASMLYTAMRTNQDYKKDSSDNDVAPSSVEITKKVENLKVCRQLTSEITNHGAKLYDLLGKEQELRGFRSEAILYPLDVNKMEGNIQSSITGVNQEIQQLSHRLENSASDEASLEAKIEKRKADLERNQKRLKRLEHVKPAYMDEYEKLEGDLQKQYKLYMEKFCNLAFLEQQLEEHNRTEQDKVEETESTLKRMQQKLQEEERRMMQDDVVSSDLLNDDDNDYNLQSRSHEGGNKVFGSMTGGRESDEDSLSSSGSALEEEDKELEMLNESEASDGVDDQDANFNNHEEESSDDDF